MPAANDVTILTKRGQISVPAHLRHDLGLKQGQRFLWEKVGEHELRLRLLEEPGAKGATQMLGFARRFRSERRSTADWMRELRAGDAVP